MTTLTPARRCPRCKARAFPDRREPDILHCLLCGDVFVGTPDVILDVSATRLPRQAPDHLQKLIIPFLQGKGWLLTRDVAQELGRKAATMSDQLSRLYEAGLIERRRAEHKGIIYLWRAL